MSIKILMLIFIILLFLMAAYLVWSLNKGIFIIFTINQNKKTKNLFLYTAFSLIIIGLIGVGILFTLDKNYNFITLILGTLAIFIFSNTFMNIN